MVQTIFPEAMRDSRELNRIESILKKIRIGLYTEKNSLGIIQQSRFPRVYVVIYRRILRGECEDEKSDKVY
jgi:hypothetical protein